MRIGIVQITSEFNSNEHPRLMLLRDEIIPTFLNTVGGEKYTLVSPPNKELQALVESGGGTFVEYTGWKKDKSRKFREGMQTRSEQWIAFLDDDILPDTDWLERSSEFLSTTVPGQYGFRLTDADDNRHEFGEDWMQFASPRSGLRHRGLRYDINSNYIEESPTSYVANSFVHKEVYSMVQPFGIFGKAPDVSWSFAIKEAGFPVGFILQARAYHLGDRKDNR